MGTRSENPWLADPVPPARTADCEEFRVLRRLRGHAKRLLECGKHVAIAVSFLSRAIYPVGSRVDDQILTTEEKDKHHRLLPDSLEILARIEAAALQCSLDIAAARKELALLEVQRTHKKLEREIGGVADLDDEDDLL